SRGGNMRFALSMVVLLAVTVLSAQEGPLSLQQGTLRDWTMQKDTMMKISAAMPGDKFTFKPTPPQRNFGEQVLHVVEASFDYGTAVLQSFSDQDLLAPAVSSRADRFMGGSNRVRIVNYVMGHT